jgi:hypothetical protein
VHTSIATLLAATPPTDSTSGCLDLWEALSQLLPLYGWLAVTLVPNTEDRRCSRKPARCGRSFAGIHQEFPWLTLQIPEPISDANKTICLVDYVIICKYILVLTFICPFITTAFVLSADIFKLHFIL